MKIGGVIRKYRKEKQLTQEELAGYLGVTAPAVNKWENGNSLPDISLLAPIARLLGISTDTLLSYKEDLTELEIDRIVEAVSTKAKEDGYDAAFQYAEENIQEYPSCTRLILLAAQVLDGYRIIYGIEGREKYEDKIQAYYVRSLESEDYRIVQTAAVSLFNFYVSKKEYEKAETYLERIPTQSFNPTQLRANLYLNQGKTDEAYPLYERILFAGFGEINGALNGIQSLAMQENDIKKAEKIAEIQKKLAEILEMGEYQKASAGLGLAIRKQDTETVLENLDVIIRSMSDIASYRRSDLYSHMTFSDAGTRNFAIILQRALENDENIGFVRQDDRYQELMKKLKKISGR